MPSYFFLVIYENNATSSSLKLAGILRFVRFAPLPTKDVAVTTPDTLRLVAVAIPNTGVTRVGLVANTLAPLPVSSVRAVARLAELKEPNEVVVLTDVIAPVKLGILVVVVAAPVSAPTKEVAVMIPDALMFDAFVCPVSVEIPVTRRLSNCPVVVTSDATL